MQLKLNNKNGCKYNDWGFGPIPNGQSSMPIGYI